MSVGLASQGIAYTADFSFFFTAIVTFVCGAVFLMWLGEQITEKGIGNGISLLIFAGIVAGLPGAVGQAFELARNEGAWNVLPLLALSVLGVATVAFVVFIERGQRRITVNYPRRQVGNKMYAGQSSYLPLKVNMAGVIPAIFASSILLFPASLGQWVGSGDGLEWLQRASQALGPGQPLYILLLARR
jgi:preprotein translocase subunit SecY